MDPLNLTQVLGRTWVLEADELIGVYFLDRRRCVLLDSGLRQERQALAEALSAAGLTPVGVLSSHIHLDHAINNGWLREAYGALIAAPEGEVPLCRSVIALRQYQYCYSPQMVRREYGDMVTRVDCPVPMDQDRFHFCGVDFSILHTPGHSLDHISIVTPDGVCYAGDAIYVGHGLHAKLPYCLDLKGMLDSTYLLENLDCQAFIACHRGTGPGQALPSAARDTREMLLARAERIRALVTRPMTFGQLLMAGNAAFSLHSNDPILTNRLERNLRLFVDFLLDAGAVALLARDGLSYLSPGANTAPVAQWYAGQRAKALPEGGREDGR